MSDFETHDIEPEIAKQKLDPKVHIDGINPKTGAVMKRRGRFTDGMIEKAIRANEGLQYLAARALGVNPTYITHRISQSKQLQQVVKDCLQLRIDEAERELQYIIRDKNPRAIEFLLRTLGKSRGYTEQVDIMVDAKVQESHQKIMHQIEALKLSKTLTSKVKTEDISECDVDE